MKQWVNGMGRLVDDRKYYYVCICDSEGDFFTDGDPESFGEDILRARLYAIEMSRKHKMVELRMERMVQDPAYDDSPVTFWSERYENGKKMWKQNWR